MPEFPFTVSIHSEDLVDELFRNLSQDEVFDFIIALEERLEDADFLSKLYKHFRGVYFEEVLEKNDLTEDTSKKEQAFMEKIWELQADIVALQHDLQVAEDKLAVCERKAEKGGK